METSIIIGIIQIGIGILTLLGVSHLIIVKIIVNRSQKTSIGNRSSNNTIIQIQDNPEKIKAFVETTKKRVGVFEKTPDGTEESSGLVKRIEYFLENNKEISIIAELCLRLARRLKMNSDEEWLSNEVYGFKEYLESDSKKGSELKEIEGGSSQRHRSIETELNIEFNGKQTEKFPLRLFMSQPLIRIEDWVNQPNPSGQMVMFAPPIQLMVDILNVDPNKEVPYMINRNSLKKILLEVRLKINDFLARAKEKIN